MTKTVIDFDALAYHETAEFTAKHPNGTVLGIIHVAGPSHPQVLEFEEQDARRKYDEEDASQRERFEAVKSGTVVPASSPYKSQEQLRKIGAKKLASYVVSADFDVKLNGKVVEFARDTAEEIFKSPAYDWIISPLWQFVNNRENFTPNSADNS